MKKDPHQPPFQARFLLPQYWPVWLFAATLYCIALLPLPALRAISRFNAMLLRRFAKKRVAVAYRNLALCYPEMPVEERRALWKKNIDYTAMALFETAIGWWWPQRRVESIASIKGLEHIDAIRAQGKGVLCLAIHNVNLEVGGRIMGLSRPAVGFYRKHDNPLMDYFQYKGRVRSNKYMIHKKNSRAFIQALDRGEVGLYLPDQDYGRAQSRFVPFGGMPTTATTAATLMFASRANCVPVLVASRVTLKGYEVTIYPPIDYLDVNHPEQSLTRLNQDILALVNEQPESYLWMHKRFKTQPDGEKGALYR